MAAIEEQITQLEEAIASLDAQRSILGDVTVDVALSALRQQLAGLRQPEPKKSAPSLAGERKMVTIMFADISGFTRLAETMDPKAVRNLMNTCFEQLVPIIEKYGGIVGKFIGAEIMALFGAPTAHENDPERALRVALEMIDALAAFNTEQGTDLSVHFGINTGLVVAGGLGTRKQQEYSVMGDAVNLAARLEGISEQGQILVGPDTYRLTAPLFEFETLEPIRVKGKAKPVATYRLLAAKTAPGRVRGITGLESPLVGRQAEFDALQQAIERLQAGKGGIVTIVGEAGLGKSRLVAEIRRGAVTAPLPAPVQWVEGRCLSYGGSIVYLLWLDVLRGLLKVALDDPPLAIRDALREQVQALCPERFESVYPYLGRLMALPLDAKDEAPLQNMDGENLKRNTFLAMESLIEGAARQHPLIVVCEDLHWASPTSIGLLKQLLDLTNRVPLLLICILRVEKEHECWRIRQTAAQPGVHHHTDLWLNPLSTAESQTLVGNLLHVEDLPKELRERIRNRAEGNPFYVEEIIRSLMDSGTIERDEAAGRWIATRDVANIAIPGTLHGVLVTRIDRLQSETKRVLQLAAVIGRTFFHRVLAAIARQERELDDHLVTLQREEMIRKRAHALELEYIFKHQLTQEAAYNGLLKKKRRAFHRQVAEALEQLFSDRIEEQMGLLAHHWERAEEPDKATEYLLRAGDQARLAYSHQEAIDYYRRALHFLQEPKNRGRAARTLMKLGLTYHTSFDFAQSRQAYEQGFALWQQAGEAQKETLPPAPHALRLWSRNPRTLDPAMAAFTASSDLADQLFSGLVGLSIEMDVVPDVAQSWEILENGCKFVFHLRDDVRWSDGDPVTAGDFEYAWKRVLDPGVKSPNANLLYAIKGAAAFHRGEDSRDNVHVQARDDITLIVELEEPASYFLHLLTYNVAYPVPRHAVDARGDGWAEAEHIVTNGPFGLDTWQQNESLILTRNPGYHDQYTGNLERVDLSLHAAEWSAIVKMYEADELDILILPPSEIDRARQQRAGEFISIPMLSTNLRGIR